MSCKRGHDYIFVDEEKYVCQQCGHVYRNRRKIKRIIKSAIKIGSVCSAIIILVVVIYNNYPTLIDSIPSDITESVEDEPTTKTIVKMTPPPPSRKFVVGSDGLLREVIDSQVDEDVKTTNRDSEDQILNKPEISVTELEKAIHELINMERQKHGLNNLVFDTKLTNIARTHSQDMANRNFFAHENPEGQDPTDRGMLVGYTCHKKLGGNLYREGIAENILQNNLYDSISYMNDVPISYDWNTQEELAQSTVEGWMNSAVHRQNILTETIDREGIGVAIASDDKVYITEDLC
ncbi:MAG: CAP domain-containing protein [Nitrosopumilaceae archaeon]